MPWVRYDISPEKCVAHHKVTGSDHAVGLVSGPGDVDYRHKNN
jgi:hypothetical protein